LKSKIEFNSIRCHNCGWVMNPEVRVIVDYIVEVRWTCIRCGAVRGAIVGAGL